MAVYKMKLTRKTTRLNPETSDIVNNLIEYLGPDNSPVLTIGEMQVSADYKLKVRVHDNRLNNDQVGEMISYLLPRSAQPFTEVTIIR